MGEASVTRALEIMQRELDLSMAFCGKTGIAQVDCSVIAGASPAWARRTG